MEGHFPVGGLFWHSPPATVALESLQQWPDYYGRDQSKPSRKGGERVLERTL
jgi:hypothetical protein